MSWKKRLSKIEIDSVLKMISVEYEDDENIFVDKFWSSYELFLENNHRRFEEKEQ